MGDADHCKYKNQEENVKFAGMLILIQRKMLVKCCNVAETIHSRPGPWVEGTKGEVWPRPKVQKSQQEFFSVRSNSFKFEVNFSEA